MPDMLSMDTGYTDKHWRHASNLILTRKPSLEVALTSLAIFLVSHEFPTGCYLFIISNSGLLFSHSAVTGFPNLTITFN